MLFLPFSHEQMLLQVSVIKRVMEKRLTIFIHFSLYSTNKILNPSCEMGLVFWVIFLGGGWGGARKRLISTAGVHEKHLWSFQSLSSEGWKRQKLPNHYFYLPDKLDLWPSPQHYEQVLF